MKGSKIKNKIFYLIVSIFLLGIAIFLITLLFSKKTEIDIYFIGRGEKDSYMHPPQDGTARFNILNYKPIKRYLNEIENYNHKVKFNLIIKNNSNNPDSSLEIFKSIEKNHSNNNPFIVIDNTWGSDLKKSANFIREKKIPIISINADHNKIFKNSSSIFIGNDDETPWIMCDFIKNILECDTINLIGESEFPLTLTCINALDHYKIVIKDSLLVPPPDTADKLTPKRVVKSSLWDNKNIPVFLNVHADNGNKILNELNKNKIPNRLLAPVYALTLSDIKQDSLFNSEIIVLDKSVEAASKYINEDIEYFMKDPDSVIFKRENASTFLLRCRRATEIIEAVITKADSLTKTNFAAKISLMSKEPIRKFGDLFKYVNEDSTLILKKDYSFIVYRNQLKYYYPLQLNDQKKVIPNITFGMQIESIHDIKVQQGTYSLDFYFWTKIDTKVDSLKNYITFKNLTINRVDTILKKLLPGTTVNYTLHKVSAICSQKFNPFYYPNDRYKLELTAEVLDNYNTVLISYDASNLNLEKSEIQQIHLEGWNIRDVNYSVDSKSQTGRLGLSNTQEERFKSLTIHIGIERKSTYEILFFIAPYFLLSLIGIFLMLIGERKFDVVGETSTGLVVGTIAYSISIAGFTPSKGNLLIIDYVSGITLFIVLINLSLIVIQSSTFISKNRQPIITRKIGYAFLGLFLISIPILIWLYRTQP